MSKVREPMAQKKNYCLRIPTKTKISLLSVLTRQGPKTKGSWFCMITLKDQERNTNHGGGCGGVGGVWARAKERGRRKFDKQAK